MKRTVKAAFFNKIGTITSDELVALPRSHVDAYRKDLTDFRRSEKGLHAYCTCCGGPLYISYALGLPYYAHFPSMEALGCPWSTTSGKNPDDLKAAQYRGQQESPFHRLMCELIGELAALDPRCGEVVIDQYLRRADTGIGRKPDVLVEWGSPARFAVEFQHSRTYQTEISGRSVDYEAAGIPLIWVVSWFDPENLTTDKHDIAARHRGNVFVLSEEAVVASRERGTLVLSCYCRHGEGYEPAVLVEIDDLTFPEIGLPFYEDREAAPLLEAAQEARRPYFKQLKDREKWESPQHPLRGTDTVPWKNQGRRLNWLVATAFDIVGVASGKPQRYTYSLTGGTPPGDQDISKLSWSLDVRLDPNKGNSLVGCADLLETFLSRTSVYANLKKSVSEHLARGRALPDVEQVDETSVEWRLLAEIFPEIMNSQTRYLLERTGALPEWAVPGDGNKVTAQKASQVT